MKNDCNVVCNDGGYAVSFFKECIQVTGQRRQASIGHQLCRRSNPVDQRDLGNASGLRTCKIQLTQSKQRARKSQPQKAGPTGDHKVARLDSLCVLLEHTGSFHAIEVLDKGNLLDIDLFREVANTREH
jgi:hypothetical protein